jgi:prophage DNA circulation protein
MAFTVIPKYSPPWRKRLRTGSFKGIPFHVEQQGRSSGRRVVEHEYPRRDMPYSEDMGRHAIRYQITGYVIQAPATWTSSLSLNWSTRLAQEAANLNQTFPPNGVPDANRFYADYMQARDLLVQALDNPMPGTLVDPYNVMAFLPEYGGYVTDMSFMCERYTLSESRERGGVATFEMNFVEAGVPGNTSVTQQVSQTIQTSANSVISASQAALDNTSPTDPAYYTPG